MIIAQVYSAGKCAIRKSETGDDGCGTDDADTTGYTGMGGR